MTDLMTRTDTRLDTQLGEHDKFSHIVYPKDKLTEAYILGTPITALCGKIFVPSSDPKKYPVCPTCKELFDTHHSSDPWEDGDGI